jgi:hypothetical protein
MSNLACAEIVDSVITHLKNDFYTMAVGADCLIVTPFLNADSAPVEIIAKQVGNNLYLSDDGEALNQLFASGLTVEGNSELTQQVNLIARLNDIQFKNSELFIETSPDKLGESVQRLATAIQSTSHLIYKKTYRVRLRFEDEVEQLLISNSIAYEAKYNIRGRASAHTVPLYVNSSHNVLLQPLTATSVQSARRKAKSIGYQWVDLRQEYKDKYQYTVVINDKNPKSATLWDDKEVQGPLTNYSTSVFYWQSDQSRLLDVLGAGSEHE